MGENTPKTQNKQKRSKPATGKKTQTQP